MIQSLRKTSINLETVENHFHSKVCLESLLSFQIIPSKGQELCFHGFSAVIRHYCVLCVYLYCIHTN